MAELLSLFFTSFLAATLLPGGSEALFIYLLYSGSTDPLWLWLVASVGNTLGGMTNWLIGLWLARRFPGPLKHPRRNKAVARLRRYGAPVLLLGWLPVIGDPLCLAAGWVGVRWWPALLWIGLGKTLRYGFLLWGMTL